MRMFEQARSYATQENAIKALKRATGEHFDTFRWMVLVNSQGRFTPVVFHSSVDRTRMDSIALAHMGIAVA